MGKKVILYNELTAESESCTSAPSNKNADVQAEYDFTLLQLEGSGPGSGKLGAPRSFPLREPR
jgi:hypothetical protein